MSTLPFYERWLFTLQTLALVGLLARLLFSRLQGIYRYFFIYVVVQCVQALIPFFLSYKAPVYALFFMITEGVIVCLYALIVLELYSLVLKDLTGIASVARRYIRLASGVAIVISLLLMIFERTPGSPLTRFYTFERAVVCSLVLFVLFIMGFLLYYPIPLHRNLIYYSVGYVVYFAAKGASLFVMNAGHSYWQLAGSTITLAASDACLIFWIFALGSQGEQRMMVLNHSWHAEDERRVLHNLKAINSGLLRARK